MGIAGALIGLAGLVAKGVAAATTPAADTRSWTSLPASVMLFTADVQPGSPVVMASAASSAQPLPIQSSKNGCWIGWGRTRSALAASSGGTAVLADASVEVGNREEKNKAFRASLVSDFSYAKAPSSSPASSAPLLHPVAAN
jgi:hypothetical protein